MLNTENIFVFIRQFSEPLKTKNLREADVHKELVAELQTVGDAFIDQKRPEFVYFAGHGDGRTAL
jgi:hypothetical protein